MTLTAQQSFKQAVWAVIPAAGIGARMGADTPKQYLRIEGRTLIEYACAALLANPGIKGLVIALHADDQVMATLPLADDARVHLIAGGAERADSVMAGLDYLASLAATDDWILVHDAARPCLETAVVDQLLEQLSQHKVGGIVARPVTDTVKRASCGGERGREIDQTVSREQLWLAQTPQMFRYGKLVRALRGAIEDGLVVTDESMALERMGYKPMLLTGAASNIKVTYPQDLALAAWYIANRSIA
jgi:2-C-methyl-D-erythritol 4-phosphate cytidylyltransferase